MKKIEENPFASMTKDQETSFKYWQKRLIISTMIGYALFYFVRKNLSFAMPGMEVDLGISKAQLGVFLTLHGLIYGISRFANGYIGDRVNARYFMALGLLLCSICNLIFGFSSALIMFGVVWMLNGWFQGMGFPPCVRLLTHWIPPQQLATKMSVWNTSHSIGAFIAAIACGYFADTFGWRWAFFIPSIIAMLGAAFLLFTLRDTPSSLGLPELDSEGKAGGSTEEDKADKEFLKKYVFKNPYIWLLACANFFVYVIRYAVLDWGPTMLKEIRGMELTHSGLLVACFEAAGIAGMLIAGWATDKFFKGRAIRVCLIYMVLATIFIFVFWQTISEGSTFVLVPVLMAAGFSIYGPQALIGIAAANLATKKAAGTAAGFTGLFGYASTIVSGVGVGLIADNWGWEHAFDLFVIVGVIGSFIFMLGWKAPANGYSEHKN